MYPVRVASRILRSDDVGWHVTRKGCLLGALPEGFGDLPLVRFPKALAAYPDTVLYSVVRYSAV